MPKVVIVILSWNRLHDTLECIASVLELGYLNIEVVVVDNGSTDNSSEVIRRIHPNVTLLDNKKNLGFAGGNNVGIRYGMERGADYLWLLNNDAVVQGDTLDELVAVAQSHPEVGLVSPLVCYYSDPTVVQFCGSYVDWESQSILYAGSPEEIIALQRERQGNLCLFGTALLIKRGVVTDVGYLDEDFFAYWEDTDYSVRTIQAGYRNVIATNATILHKTPFVGKEEVIVSPYYFYYMVRNEYRFWMKHLQFPKTLRFLRRYLAFMLREAGRCGNRISRECAEACLDGGWCAFLGMYGPRTHRGSMPKLLKKCFLWHPDFLAQIIEGSVSTISSRLRKKIALR